MPMSWTVQRVIDDLLAHAVEIEQEAEAIREQHGDRLEAVMADFRAGRAWQTAAKIKGEK